MRKIITLSLAVLVVISLVLIGCKTESAEKEITETETATEEETEEVEEAEEQVEEAEEPYTIEIWDFQNVEAWTNAYNEIFGLFTEEHPNISFDRKTQSFADGEALLKAAALSGDIPDILNLWAGEILYSWIDGGLIENMEPYMKADEEWWARIGKVVTGDPASRDREGNGIWMCPADIYSEISFYYKDVSQQLGLIDPPTTIDDVTANCAKLEDSEYIPIGTGLLDPGMFREIFLLFVSQQLDDGIAALDMYQQAERGEISWNNETFLNAVTAIDKWNPYHTSDAMTLDQQTIGYERLFTKKTWYEWYCGSWMLGEFEKQSAADIEAGNVGIVPYPAVTTDYEANFTVSGMGATYSLNAASEGKEIVLEFLKFMSDPKATAIFAKNSIFPAGPVENPEQYVSPFFAEYLSVVQQLKVSPYPIGVVPEVTNEFQTNLQNMFTGDISPEEVLASMDAMTQK